MRKLELGYLLKSSESECFTYIRRMLHSFDYNLVVDPKNYIFAIPRSTCTPVCLVAHMDTVRDYTDQPIDLRYLSGTIDNRNGVLGADDRAGIAIILQIIRRMKHLPYLLFTLGEESGCTGVKAFIRKKKLDPYLDDINAFIEYDRRGFNEMVTYSSRVPKEFLDLFKAYGYESKYGSTSDVRHLTEAYGISHVNLSAGYILQHTQNELLFLHAMDFAVAAGLRVLGRIGKQYILDPPVYNTAYTNRFTTNYNSMACGYAETECNVCGHRKWTNAFHPSIGVHLCGICEAKIKSRSDLDMVTVVGVKDLKREYTSSAFRKPDITPPKVSVGLNTCPVCLQSEKIAVQGTGAFQCLKCGLHFYVDKGEKLWYTYEDRGKGEGGGYKTHTIKVVPKISVHQPNCPKCKDKRRLYSPTINGEPRIMCFTCMNKLRKAGTITREALRDAVKARKAIPF